MKLITDRKDLQKEFIRLMNEYDEYYWTMAWASANHPCFHLLLTNRRKVKKILVGTHFYQTDPQFISEFINVTETRFILLPEVNGNS